MTVHFRRPYGARNALIDFPALKRRTMVTSPCREGLRPGLVICVDAALKGRSSTVRLITLTPDASGPPDGAFGG